MRLDLLASRIGGAAENMATDFLLLQRYSRHEYIRFRHYGWQRPAFTFGYSQKISFVRGCLPLDGAVELCRRPSGGGLVDHRNDWTYALIIPRNHAAYEAPATESYRVIHLCLADALQAQGQEAGLKDRLEDQKGGAGICFDRAELHDVVQPATGQKIAGAAQKRNKHGLLFQGSLARDMVSESFAWDNFQQDFCERLASALAAEQGEAPWPDWPDDELSQLVEHYSASEWNEFR